MAANYISFFFISAILLCQDKDGEEDPWGSWPAGSLNAGSPTKKTKRAQKLSLSSDSRPVWGGSTGNEPMMELLLVMYSQMLAWEDYVTQQDQDDHDQPQKDEAVQCGSPTPATCSVRSS